MPRLSVVMPMRNAATTVRTAALSTLRAMPRDSELVVVDDGSTDRSVAVLSGIGDPRVRVVSLPHSIGVAGALNRALETVDSELVGRMDADDICLPWRFARQIPRIGRHTDVCFGQVFYFRREPTRVRPLAPVPISARAMPLHLVLFNPVAHPTMLAPTRLVREAGGYRAVPAEDYELWMRLAARGHRIERLALPLIGVRHLPSSVTASTAYRARPPLDEGARDSYLALCERAVGRAPAWSPNPRRNPQSRSALVEMTDSVRSGARHLPPRERMVLERKLRAVLALATPEPAEPR